MYAPFVCIDINRSFLEKHQVLNLNLRDISTHIKPEAILKRTIFALKVSGLKFKLQAG